MNKCILVLLFILVNISSKAQLKKESKIVVKELPSLEKVLDYSEQNSHLVKEQNALAEHFGQSVKVAQKLWMDKVFMDLGAQRSNNGAVLNVNNNISNSEFNSLSFQAMNSFRVGITVRLSLYDMVARKDLIKQAQYRQVAAEQHSKFLSQDVKFRITDLYKDAQLAYKLLSIKAEKKYALFLQKEMAEKEFQQGQLHISELGRITELASNAFAEFEQASTTYEKLYYQLEIMLGVSLKDLK
ncbi:MAG: TolC family protein [Spirosomaceae bacterium]|jgi:outer membrane protein TolC|nr:TolC family protein [Spirosomataceae bacterium]